MNKIKKNKKALIISLVVIILMLIILSNVVKAVISLNKINHTRDFGEYIANNPKGFIYDATPGQIFALNARNGNNGINRGGDDSDHKAVLCVFHNQADIVSGNIYSQITTVVDMETPGDVVVYLYKGAEIISTGEVGTKTENGNTITEIATINENNKDKKVKVTYTKNILDLTDEERESFEELSWLMYRGITNYGTKSTHNKTKNCIHYYWQEIIKEYMKKKDVLNSYFDVNVRGTNSDANTVFDDDAQAEKKLAGKEAEKILKVSLTKGDTEPEIYYGENNKAYIGPLKAQYEGGTTSIKVQGNSGEISANWATKNEGNGTFNEQTGNITSNQPFYAVVDASQIEGIDNVNVKVYLNYTKAYKARFALVHSKTANDQNLLIFDGNKDEQEGQQEVEWNVENTKPKYGDLIIRKNDENNMILPNIEFTLWKAISANTGYLRLSKDSKFVEKINTEINLNDYKVEYVGINELNKATKFVTNAEGEIIIRNFEYAKGSRNYKLYLREETNNNYGYKGMSVTIDDVDIQGGSVAKVEDDGDIEFTIGQNDTILTLNIQNNPELAPLEILKVSEDGTSTLEDVKLKIEIGKGEYLQLNDVNGIVSSVKGQATINKNNVAQDSQYSVKYVTDKSIATEFITDKDGKIIINNLEVNASRTQKYTYTAHETYNPNYGYGSKTNTSLSKTVQNLVLNETSQIKINNTIDLGNIKLEKYDENNSNIKLENVGFAIEISPSPEKAYAYLALYNKEGNIVSNVKGTATINSKNIATENEYEVRYYSTDKSISELTEEERKNITTFVTEKDGTLAVNNLEVYEASSGEKYKYKLIEISNSNYGFVASSQELANITLESNTTIDKQFANKQTYTKLSGYVWVENSSGKSNNYDGVYIEGTEGKDLKLTDLYIMQEGKLIKNPNATVKVEIKLRNKVTGEFIKTIPDEFDNQTGKYTFDDVKVAELEKYEIVFVYDGFYYTTVVEQLDKDNGSKVEELPKDREALSNKFEAVKENGQVVSTDGTVNTVEYYKDGHTSTVSKLNFDTTVSANTTLAEYNLKNAFDAKKANSSSLTNELENINMGIVLREQPKISLNSDIYSVLLQFEGHSYNYKYDGRKNYYENVNGDEFGVKFEEKYAPARYTRTVYASDVQAAKDQGKDMNVLITYKMQVANQSRTLSTKVGQIIDYFDSRYSIKAVGLSLDENAHIATNNLTFSTPQDVQGHSEYKSTVIDFSQLVEVQKDKTNVKDLYITFEISTKTEAGKNAIYGLLDEKSTYHNASEILNYSTYYGKETSKVNGTQFITDTTSEGSLYAGIDRMSQPGNMEIVLTNHESVDGTPILDTSNFEDDTASAPSLILDATESRKLSGTIFEDTDTGERPNEKIGDGIYNEGVERPIQNVTVELHKLNSDGSVGDIATYSNGERVTATTDEKGNYTFGYDDKDKKIHIGILPGKYVVQYTYNNQSYIVGKENINLLDYKSTIITSEIIKKAFDGENLRWYMVQEPNRYSDARDDISLRPEYQNMDASITVNNSTYNKMLSIDTMKAQTPVMDISIEFTEADEIEALTLERKVELTNIDFGIIERPDVDIKIEKEITGLEIVAQNGTNIVPKGNPSDINSRMQYVRKLDGIVSAEIETKLLQGAALNLEYTITVTNNSDKDYLHTDYYYYGIAKPEFENTAKAKQVVDYLDKTMSLNAVQDEGIWTERTADDLYNSETKEGLVTEEVYNQLKSGDYHILTTEAFDKVETGTQKSVKLYATRILAASNDINEENRTEIIEITGKRTIKQSVPGNYNPAESVSHEPDADKVELIIIPPTGTTTNYILYIIAAVVTFVILVSGIVIIKKKALK